MSGSTKDSVRRAKGILSGMSRREKIDAAEQAAVAPKKKPPKKKVKPKKDAAQATRDNFWN